jgi:hypothetical protein
MKTKKGKKTRRRRRSQIDRQLTSQEQSQHHPMVLVAALVEFFAPYSLI